MTDFFIFLKKSLHLILITIRKCTKIRAKTCVYGFCKDFCVRFQRGISINHKEFFQFLYPFGWNLSGPLNDIYENNKTNTHLHDTVILITKIPRLQCFGILLIRGSYLSSVCFKPRLWEYAVGQYRCRLCCLGYGRCVLLSKIQQSDAFCIKIMFGQCSVHFSSSFMSNI